MQLQSRRMAINNSQVTTMTTMSVYDAHIVLTDVESKKLRFCLVGLLWRTPFPPMMHPPVWLLIPGFTAFGASI